MILEAPAKGSVLSDSVESLPTVRHPSAGVADEVQLIGVASGIGALDKGCAAGPDVLKRLGLDRRLRDYGLGSEWKGIVRPPNIRGRTAGSSPIHAVLADLAERVSSFVRRRQRFAVIGGDHSCAIGTWSGATNIVRARGELGLIWIDAHMDSHTPITSPTGALHGMPLACLLGYGEGSFTGLCYNRPKIRPEHVCLLGVRSFEAGEAQLLERLGVRVIFMDDVNRYGLEAVFHEAIEIACHETVGFGVSIDLDAVDPSEAPGVGSPFPGGLSGRELVDCMTSIAAVPSLVGMEIAELNPLHDLDAMTARLTCDLLVAGLGGMR